MVKQAKLEETLNFRELAKFGSYRYCKKRCDVRIQRNRVPQSNGVNFRDTTRIISLACLILLRSAPFSVTRYSDDVCDFAQVVLEKLTGKWLRFKVVN